MLLVSFLVELNWLALNSELNSAFCPLHWRYSSCPDSSKVKEKQDWEWMNISFGSNLQLDQGSSVWLFLVSVVFYEWIYRQKTVKATYLNQYISQSENCASLMLCSNCTNRECDFIWKMGFCRCICTQWWDHPPWKKAIGMNAEERQRKSTLHL